MFFFFLKTLLTHNSLLNLWLCNIPGEDYEPHETKYLIMKQITLILHYTFFFGKEKIPEDFARRRIFEFFRLGKKSNIALQIPLLYFLSTLMKSQQCDKAKRTSIKTW